MASSTNICNAGPGLMSELPRCYVLLVVGAYLEWLYILTLFKLGSAEDVDWPFVGSEVGG